MSNKFGGKPPRGPRDGGREGKRGGDGPPRREGKRYDSPPPWHRDERASEGSRPGGRREFGGKPKSWDDHSGGRRGPAQEMEWERPRRPSSRIDVAGPPVQPPKTYPPEQLAKAAEKVVAASMEVQRHLGSALDQVTYHRAIAMELQARGIPFEREERVPISYKGRQIDTRRVDFIVEGCLVEVLSQPVLDETVISRATGLLRASGYQMAVLINFGPPKIEVRKLSVTAVPS